VWDALGELGLQLGVDELVEFAAAVSLAARHGARVASSLAARAEVVRSQLLADVEAQAQSATERMGLPAVGMFAGLLFLLGYPAVQLILGSH
jgi:Flp pilus assembly protein TadB